MIGGDISGCLRDCDAFVLKVEDGVDGAQEAVPEDNGCGILDLVNAEYTCWAAILEHYF